MIMTPKKLTYFMKAIMAVLTLTLPAGACSSSADEEQGTTPVAFAVRMAGDDSTATTRAATAIGTNAELSAKGGFGVFACYTGLYKYVDSNVHPDFMYNEHVEGDVAGTTWTYSPLKYWPNGEGEAAGLTGENPHHVSFFAYAPYTNGLSPDPENHPTDYCIASFSQQGEMGNPWLTYRLHTDWTKQVDLLCARPLLDQTKPSIGDKLHFVFDHALACVGDRVTVVCSSGLESQINNRVNGITITNAKVVVTSFKIEYKLTAKARLVLWNNGDPNWKTILSEEPMCTRTVTFLNLDNSEDDVTVYAKANNIPSAIELGGTWAGQGVFYIPAELDTYTQTATVSLTFHIATYNGTKWIEEEDKVGTATLNLHDYKTADPNTNAYHPGKHLYINVTLNPMDIALTAAIAAWEDGGTVEVEGIEE